MSSNQEAFPIVDLAKRGYKILVILYELKDADATASTIKPHVFPSLFLREAHGKFVDDTQNYVLDLHLSEHAKKHQKFKILKSIENGYSPIVVWNVRDIELGQSLYTTAVSHGYMLEVLNSANGQSLSALRNHLLSKVNVMYKGKLPQLRRHPAVFEQNVDKEMEAIIQEFIRQEYSQFMEKDEKKRNANELKRNNVGNLREKDKKEEKEQEGENPSLVDITDIADRPDSPWSNDETEAANSKKYSHAPCLPYTRPILSHGSGDEDASAKQKEEPKNEALQLHQAFIKSTQEDIYKNMEENKKSIGKAMENLLKSVRSVNEKQTEALAKRIDEHLEAFMRKAQDDVNKKFEENNEIMTRKMEILLDKLETSMRGRIDALSQRVEMQTSPSKVAAMSEDEEEDFKSKAKHSPPYEEPKVTKQNHHKAMLTEDPVDRTDESKRIAELIKAGYKVMVLMRGLPGSGKTFLAGKLLEDTLGSVDKSKFIFNPHDYFFQESSGAFSYNAQELEKANMFNQRRCFQAINQGVSPIIVDSANTQVKDMQVYCAMAVQFGYMLEILEMETAWALKPNELAKKNTCDLSKTQIQKMVKNYVQHISPPDLLKEFNLKYTEIMPQYRMYPPCDAIKETGAVKKPPAEYVHKFAMKHGKEALDDLSDASDDENANKEKNKDNNDEIRQLRKHIKEKDGVIQHLQDYLQRLNERMEEYSYSRGCMARDSMCSPPMRQENEMDFHNFTTTYTTSILPGPTIADVISGVSKKDNRGDNFKKSASGAWTFKTEAGAPDDAKKNNTDDGHTKATSRGWKKLF